MVESVGHEEAYPPHDHDAYHWEDYSMMIAQTGKGGKSGKGGPKGGCYTCGGDHYQRDCPKGQGKGEFGKNGGYAKGKGKGKGQCYSCGGPHFQKDCPKAKGKGYGKSGHKGKGKGIHEVQAADYDWEEHSSWNWYGPHWSSDEAWDMIPIRAVHPTTRKDMRVEKEKKIIKTQNRFSALAPSAEVNRDNVPEPSWVREECLQKYTKKAIQHVGENKPKSTNAKEKRLGMPICAVQEGEWEVIKVTVDSAAWKSVWPRRVAQVFPLEESEMSRKGQEFCAANETTIKNYGQRRIRGTTGCYSQLAMTVQVADVSKPLLSVNELNSNGNRVVFYEDQLGGHIRNVKTGKMVKLYSEDGECKFDLWVPAAKGIQHTHHTTTHHTTSTQHNTPQHTTPHKSNISNIYPARVEHNCI